MKWSSTNSSSLEHFLQKELRIVLGKIEELCCKFHGDVGSLIIREQVKE